MKSAQLMAQHCHKGWKENQNSMDLLEQSFEIFAVWQKIPSIHLKIGNIMSKSTDRLILFFFP